MLTSFHFLIACVGFPAAPWAFTSQAVHRKSSFDYLFWLPYFHKSSWMRCCGGCIWSVRFFEQMLNDVRGRTTKGFFFLLFSRLSNVPPAIHDVNQQKQEVNSSLPVFLHLLSLLCYRNTWRGPRVAEVGPAGVCVQPTAGELLQQHHKHQMQFCVTSN